jgi:hypothetical protein
MSRPPRQDRRLTKILAALRTHGGPGRSPLYRWMRRHHDALAEAFAETPPAWTPLAAEMAAVGLTDADGKPPSPTSVRQTWYRVRRDLARARELAASKKAPPALVPDEIAPAVHAVLPRAPAGASPAVAAPRPAMTLDIRPARPAAADPPLATAVPGSAAPAVAASVTSSPGPSAPLPANAPETEDAAAQLRRLGAAMAANKVPLPKVM